MKQYDCWTLLLLVIVGANAANEKIFCYYQNTAAARNGSAKVEINSLNTTLCTHFIYSSLGIFRNGSVRILNGTEESVANFTSLKAMNTNIKVLVSLVLTDENMDNLENEKRRSRLAKSITAFLRKFKLDGVDIYWMPKYAVSKITKQLFPTLVKDFRDRFSTSRLMITISISREKDTITSAYVFGKLNGIIDNYIVHSFDYNCAMSSNVTGMNSPLYAGKLEKTAASKVKNVDTTIKTLMNQRATANKIIMGIPSYGKLFTLVNKANTSLSSPTIRPSAPNADVLMAYSEICLDVLANKNWTVVFENVTKVPYAFYEDRWLTFENEQSIKLKVDYIKKNRLGGAMLWSIDYDDTNNICNQTTAYRVLKAINTNLLPSTATKV